MGVKPRSALQAVPALFVCFVIVPSEKYPSTRRTLLGSCVSISLWHPRRKIGGMCHYMLPSRGGCEASAPDGRYADEVIALMLQERCP